jgi:protein-S-isoprenylcysteine O-methyltransferase Ste14
MHVIDIIILVGWVVFWVFWLAASFTAKTGRTRWGQFAGIRFVAILVFLFLIRLRVFKGHAVVTNPWLEGIGTAVFVLGLALAVWARVYLGRNWGVPMSRKAEPELVTTGPYKSVRHPIYSGIILAMIGTTLAVSVYWLVAVVFASVYFSYSAVMEERYMATQFPTTYPAYKHSTKMLVPHVI